MPSSKYFDFIVLQLLSYKKRHIVVFLLSVLIVMLAMSVIFVTSSLKNELDRTIKAQSDFIVQRYVGGKAVDTPILWIDDILSIDGVSEVVPRVWGEYFYEPNETYFMIVGLDMFDKEVNKNLKNLLPKIDIKKFYSKDYMIIGRSVKKFLDEYKYEGYYSFRPPDRSIKDIYIYDVLPKSVSLFASDIVLMSQKNAKEVLGIGKDYVTDIALNVPNPKERQSVLEKLKILFFDARIIQKKDIKRYYHNLYNYKGGVFVVFYIVVLLGFFLLLYQRYTIFVGTESKEIGILRLVGWSIKEIIFAKLMENLFLALLSFMIGVLLAYCYVFYFDAFLLRNIFLGYGNLDNEVVFTQHVAISDIVSVFFAFVVPYIASIIIPVWQKSISEPTEVLR